MRDLFVGSIFIPFVLSQSIEAYNRPRGQSERRDTLICQCLLAVLRAFIVRLFKGADFSHPFLFDVSLFLLKHSKRKNTQGSEKVRETENERERETNKKFSLFRVGVRQHVVGCHGTYPPVFRPLRNITVLWSLLHHNNNDCLGYAFIKKTLREH